MLQSYIDLLKKRVKERVNLFFFIKKDIKILLVKKKDVPLHPHLNIMGWLSAKALGYGVMVTLQILVLSFLVRVRVPQHKKGFRMEAFFHYCFSSCSVFSASSIALILSRTKAKSSFSF